MRPVSRVIPLLAALLACRSAAPAAPPDTSAAAQQAIDAAIESAWPVLVRRGQVACAASMACLAAAEVSGGAAGAAERQASSAARSGMTRETGRIVGLRMGRATTIRALPRGRKRGYLREPIVIRPPGIARR